MQCDMCGVESNLLRVEIEGTEINACQKCARFGKVISNFKSKQEIVKEQTKVIKYVERKKVEKKEVPIEVIVTNYSKIIRNKREEIGIKQKHMAKKLNEKESLLQKIEQGSIRPSIPLAKKIERVLGIKLVTYDRPVDRSKFSKTKSGFLTIGDMIDFKK